MAKKNTITEFAANLDYWQLDGPADQVIAHITEAVDAAKAAGYYDLSLALGGDDYYGHEYTLTGTRDMTQKELDKAKHRRVRDKANAIKSKTKTAEANRLKDLRAIAVFAKKYPTEMREQMLAQGE